MHDLKLGGFLQEPGGGLTETFTSRGTKDNPPYLHDGGLLTFEDTVEFFIVYCNSSCQMTGSLIL
ncbi:MAG: hypothetical protein ABI284_06225 [Nitrosospira sp.]